MTIVGALSFAVVRCRPLESKDVTDVPDVTVPYSFSSIYVQVLIFRKVLTTTKARRSSV